MARTSPVLVTGTTGFLGQRVVGQLLSAGFAVVALNRATGNHPRITPYHDQLEAAYETAGAIPGELFVRHKFQAIVHLATTYGRSGETELEVGLANLVYGMRLLELAIAGGCPRFVNAGTWWPAEMSPYSLAKHQFAEWGHIVSKKIQFLELTIQQMYGPGDRDGKFLPWLIQQLKSGARHIPLTDGLQLRDFVHVEDVASAFVAALSSPGSFDSFDRVDVGTGTLTPLRDVILELGRHFAARDSISEVERFDFGSRSYRENEPDTVAVDLGRIQRTGWRPLVPLSEGLKTVLAD